jgi:protein-S-isoprenylcysteine O-methyltransferase Ste14
MFQLDSHYYDLFGVVFFSALYCSVLLLFPYYRKMSSKPKKAYFAFVLAFAIEMHGIPFSMLVISWLFNKSLPLGFLWGHTLFPYIGHWGMYINIALALIAILVISNGWKNIYKHYWSKPAGQGELVTSGIYRYIRHPQYTGLFLFSLGMLIEWVTIPLLLMFPIIVVMYTRLADREENDMVKEFGDEYIQYRKRTKRFIPFLW